MGNDSYTRFHRAVFIEVHIVIFTGGIIRKGFFVNQAIKKADKIFAADSGATVALSFGISPELVIGDMDSIDESTLQKLQIQHIPLIKSPKEKDQTDTELAIDEAIKQHATEVTLIGGIEGDRLDHILANIFLLTAYDIPIRFVNGNTQCWVAKGSSTIEINGDKNDLISLIPIQSDITHITTSGLQYSLSNETLTFGKARGISNVMTEKTATITFEKGNLIIIQYTNNPISE